MIVGGYLLHLYCDTCNRPRHRDNNGDLVTGNEFSADSKQSAYQRARKLGWRINESQGTAMCPLCVKERT